MEWSTGTGNINNVVCETLSAVTKKRQTVVKDLIQPRYQRNTFYFTTTGVLPTCNVIVSESFVLTYNATIFQIEKLIKNSSTSGCLINYFDQIRLFEKISLTEDAKRIMYTPNAGGSSIESETLSFEMLKKSFNAKLFKTEMEVSYWPEGGSITDYVCCMFDSVIGVSVTRAMKYNGEFTFEDATKLLEKKLKGIYHSSKNSLVKWDKQILHVWLLSHQNAQIIMKAWNELEQNLKGNTVLLVTIAEKSDELFRNKAALMKKLKLV